MALIKLSNSWSEYLGDELQKAYMQKLERFLFAQYEKKKIIFPEVEHLVRALDLVDVKRARVVIFRPHRPVEPDGCVGEVLPGIMHARSN